MVHPVDPNQVLLTGENSFIRLHDSEGGPMTTRSSHWRILLSPAGQGHVLFLQSELTDDEVIVYADNIALARWLQEEIESMLFPPFADQDLPVEDAVFSRSGDGTNFWMETAETAEHTVNLTWYDFDEPFAFHAEPGTDGRPLGVYSCFVPARRAQLTLDDDVAQGRPFPQMRGDRTTSTACLAWSETWVRPY